MLRIAGDQQAPPDVPLPDDAQEAPDESVSEPEVLDEPASKRYSKDKLDPMVVVYMPSSMGPFQCSNCYHFQEDGSCSVVSGQIDPAGLCHVFSPKGVSTEQPEEAVEPVGDEESQDESYDQG